jgi:hypothetical protein
MAVSASVTTPKDLPVPANGQNDETFIATAIAVGSQHTNEAQPYLEVVARGSCRFARGPEASCLLIQSITYIVY